MGLRNFIGNGSPYLTFLFRYFSGSGQISHISPSPPSFENTGVNLFCTLNYEFFRRWIAPVRKRFDTLVKCAVKEQLFDFEGMMETDDFFLRVVQSFAPKLSMDEKVKKALEYGRLALPLKVNPGRKMNKTKKKMFPDDFHKILHERRSLYGNIFIVILPLATFSLFWLSRKVHSFASELFTEHHFTCCRKLTNILMLHFVLQFL
jgi:hypothetical protein